MASAGETMINPLGRELFALVHADQGYGYVSEAIEVAESNEEVMRVARASLTHTEACAAKLRGFIKMYGG